MATINIKGERHHSVDHIDLVDVIDLTNELTNLVNNLKTQYDAAVSLINQERQATLYAAFGNPGFQIRTNFDVQNATAIYYTNNGTLKTLAATSAFDTGTAATIATTKWGAALLSVDASGTGKVTWFTNAGAGYASEAAAISALTVIAATETVLGYITVLAAGTTWTAGTDALQGGTGGTPATTTNYYNSINPNAAQIGAVSAVTTQPVIDNVSI